jgi:hypothetical protein
MEALVSSYLASKENKMAVKVLPEFCERENSKLFDFYSFNRNKNTIKETPSNCFVTGIK